MLMLGLKNIDQKTLRKDCAGFTLIELMIAVAVIAIIAGVALSSYQDSVLKSKRKTAMGALYEIASSQEEYFINQKGYATLLSQIGYTANGTSTAPVYIDTNGNETNSADAIYKIFIQDGATTASFGLSAEPVNSQLKDADCGTLSMNSTGTRSISGSGTTTKCFR